MISANLARVTVAPDADAGMPVDEEAIERLQYSMEQASLQIGALPRFW